MKYPSPKGGEWIQPRKRDYRMMCCDCGLVHRMNFRVIVSLDGRKTWKVLQGSGLPHKVQFQAYRHNRATAAARRKYETIRIVKGPKAKTR